MTEEKQTELTINEKAPLSADEKAEAIEAILFAAGYPLTYEKLSEVLGIPEGDVKAFIADYQKEYNSAPRRGIMLVTLGEAAQLCTKEKYISYIREALDIHGNGKLSGSSLEVLAIVAYNQPVTKAYIEQVRGVDCSYPIGVLCDRNMIEPKGRLDAPGRPILYGTTSDFLRCFGLDDIEALPSLSEEQKQ